MQNSGACSLPHGRTESRSGRNVRVGGLAPDDAQVAQMACEHVDVLQRVLPELEFTRFILRGEDGVLYSPHLVERTSDSPLGTRSDPRSRAPRTHDMPGC
ncbi:MAG: hypothetical protein ABF812_05240 [Gluconobacter cerinus]|uniref:hypothetical protein n=1 Tax=Gluconobacter cerinus TaxID=38307 RepID=UPI0039ECD34D